MIIKLWLGFTPCYLPSIFSNNLYYIISNLNIGEYWVYSVSLQAFQKIWLHIWKLIFSVHYEQLKTNIIQKRTSHTPSPRLKKPFLPPKYVEKIV